VGVAESDVARPAPLSAAAQTPQEQSSACLNCGATLSGPFCAACGQRDIPPYPSVRELVIDAFWELSGWDGRFASTVRELFRHPGTLTREFLEGRRARYLSPLRLYLMASLVYFLAAAAAPKPDVGPATIDLGGLRIGAAGSVDNAPGRVASVVSTAARSQQTPDSAKREATLKDIARAPAILRPFLRRVVIDPRGFRSGLLEAMPRMLFALVPVFAAIVALFYRGRKYAEHLYFAIHFHAFVFLAMLIGVAARFVAVPAVSSTAGFVLFLWIPTYATLSFRRLYGGSIAETLLKEAGIGILYLIASFVALLTTIYFVALWS
jgi:hypothetical protein